MFKYNIGDTVLYKGRKKYIVGRMYIEKGDNISVEYKLSFEHKNVKEDELKELPNYSVEIKPNDFMEIIKLMKPNVMSNQVGTNDSPTAIERIKKLQKNFISASMT